jgi:hypothetical protein
MKSQSSTRILYQLRLGFIILTVLIISLGILATTKIQGISQRIQQVNDNYIVIAEIGSLIDENVYEATQAMRNYFDTGVGITEAKQSANTIDQLLIGELLQSTLKNLQEPSLSTATKMLRQATHNYTLELAALEKEERISSFRMQRLLFLETKVVNLSGIVKTEAWERANSKVQAANQLSQDTKWLIFLSALFVTMASLALVGASFVLVRDFTAQQESLLLHYRNEAELERNLREAEVKILHAQINPHFIFNTLGVISSIGLAEGMTRITEIVKALADLLRYGLKFAGKLVPLAKEIDLVEKYLLIQKERFGERLRYSIQMEPALADLQLPALTLQPLVENALIHGIEPCEEGGFVRIKAYQQAGEVVLSVSDSGQGSKPEVLAAKLKAEEDKNHLGLELVFKRLQHLLGSRVKMDIFTSEGRGLRVQVRILAAGSPAQEPADEPAVFPLAEES